MSKAEKIKRAEEYLDNNDKILAQVAKLCKQYRHNHECARNLYKKAQIDEWNWPSRVKSDGYLSYTFDY